MNKYSFFAAAASVLLVVSCGGGAYQSAAGVEVPAEVKAGEVAFSMVAVPGESSRCDDSPGGVEWLFDFSIAGNPGIVAGCYRLGCGLHPESGCTCGHGFL